MLQFLWLANRWTLCRALLCIYLSTSSGLVMLQFLWLANRSILCTASLCIYLSTSSGLVMLQFFWQANRSISCSASLCVYLSTSSGLVMLQYFWLTHGSIYLVVRVLLCVYLSTSGGLVMLQFFWLTHGSIFWYRINISIGISIVIENTAWQRYLKIWTTHFWQKPFRIHVIAVTPDTTALKLHNQNTKTMWLQHWYLFKHNIDFSQAYHFCAISQCCLWFIFSVFLL